jgi:hypothetical protein
MRERESAPPAGAHRRGALLALESSVMLTANDGRANETARGELPAFSTSTSASAVGAFSISSASVGRGDKYKKNNFAHIDYTKAFARRECPPGGLGSCWCRGGLARVAVRSTHTHAEEAVYGRPADHMRFERSRSRRTFHRR